MQPFRSIAGQAGFVVVDFRGCKSYEFFQAYQDFGALCARRQVRGALLRTGYEQAEAHYALRDILETLSRIAEIPVNFNVAMVATSSAIARVYSVIRRELAPLGCDTRLFRAESEAGRWLMTAAKVAVPHATRGTAA